MNAIKIVKDMMGQSRHEPITTPKNIRDGTYIPPVQEKHYEGTGHFCKFCEKKYPDTHRFAMREPYICKTCKPKG